MENFKVPKKINLVLIVFAAIGLIGLGVGFSLEDYRPRAWSSLLILGVFLLMVSLAGGFFTALQFISGATWSVVIRRIPETMVSVLPYAIVIIAIIIAGVFGHWHHIYHWADPEVMKGDEILQGKAWYLNAPGMAIRFGVYVIFWLGLGFMLKKVSVKQDETKDPSAKESMKKISAAYMVFFALTAVFASIDLIMSIEPHWYSTMYPIYFFSGLAYTGVATMIILAITTQRHGALKEMKLDHLHDLGKFQFMFTVFWAYIAFSQFMLIWYANLKEETPYLETRLEGPWMYFTIFLWVFHFVVPFLILLSSQIKKTPNKLIKVTWFIVFMGFIDLVWLVNGGIQHADSNGHVHSIFPITPLEICAFFSGIGIFGLAFLKAYSKVKPLPVGDPDLEESLHFHQTH